MSKKPFVYRERVGKWCVRFPSHWDKITFYVRPFRTWKNAIAHLERNQFQLLSSRGYSQEVQR